MKSQSLSKSIIKTLHISLIFLLLCPSVSSGQSYTLDNPNIRAELINPEDNSLGALNDREIKLSAQKVKWKEGDSIQKLLLEKHFSMNSDTVGILYKLNPDMDVKSIKPGQEIILPIVKNEGEFAGEFKKGDLVLLTLDNDLKQDFCRVATELSVLATKTSGLNVQQFESPAEKDNFIKATNSIVETTKTFKVVIEGRTGSPLGSDMIRSMLSEAEQAKLIINHAIESKQKLSRSDAQTMVLIAKNMDNRQKFLGAEKKGEERQSFGPVETPEKATWNAWFEEYPSKTEVEDALIVSDTHYIINIDLSKYYYRKQYAAIPDIRIKKLKQVTLRLQPIIIGEFIRSVDDKPFEAKVLTADLRRETPDHEEKAKAYKDGKISTSEFAKAVNLGSSVSWGIVATSPGCAILAFSVWNDVFTEPLDHLLVTIPVIEKGQKVPENCRIGVSQKGMQATLDTLLLMGPSGAGAEGKLADAALHVFEVSTGGEKRSTAVFVNREELKEARNNPSAKNKGVYNWVLPSALSDYVSVASQLPQSITEAHEKAEEGETCPYMDIPPDLASVLFNATAGRNLKQAESARESMKRLKDGAVILTHLVSAGGSVIYVPLALLGAKTQTTSTPRRFTVLQTLPRQRTIEGACIGSWTFAMPSRLGGVDTGEEANLLLKNAPAVVPPINAWLKNHTELVQYFESKGREEGRGEGLVLLAHHGDGYIWYSKTESPSRIKATRITRKFPPGSVAILAACSTSGVCQENRKLVEQLNERGVYAMILSPFAVVPAFGIQLALKFQAHVQAELKKKSNITFLELYQLALHDTIKAFDKKVGYQDMALEFQVVGPASLRLCSEQ